MIFTAFKYNLHYPWSRVVVAQVGVWRGCRITPSTCQSALIWNISSICLTNYTFLTSSLPLYQVIESILCRKPCKLYRFKEKICDSESTQCPWQEIWKGSRASTVVEIGNFLIMGARSPILEATHMIVIAVTIDDLISRNAWYICKSHSKYLDIVPMCSSYNILAWMLKEHSKPYLLANHCEFHFFYEGFC